MLGTLRLLDVEPAPAAADVDLLDLFVASQRSPATQVTYRRDLSDFFGDSTAADVLAWLAMPRRDLVRRLLVYKAKLMASGLAPASVNRRLAAVASLIRFAHGLDLCASDGAGLIQREKVRRMRDVAGVGAPQAAQLLGLPDRSTVRGCRDRALLGVALELGLRVAEICALDVADVDCLRLRVVGKGSAGQATVVSISAALLADIESWCEIGALGSGALFLSLDHRPAHQRRRLTAQGVRRIVAGYGLKLGLAARLTPHKLRHTAITAAVAAAGGDLFAAAEFSRHADPRTVAIYNDVVDGGGQGRLSRAISAVLRGG